MHRIEQQTFQPTIQTVHCKKCLQPAVLTAQPNGSIITHSSEIDIEVSKKVCNQARFSAANKDMCSQAKLMCVN